MAAQQSPHPQGDYSGKRQSAQTDRYVERQAAGLECRGRTTMTARARRDVILAIGIMACLAVPFPSTAQVTTAIVTGSVHDQQGGVVPGATVVLISSTRGTRVADVQTNQNGDFVFPNVPGDAYVVEVTLEGFRTVRREGVNVSPGDRVVVPSLTLSGGVLNDNVTVTAEAVLIQA